MHEKPLGSFATWLTLRCFHIVLLLVWAWISAILFRVDTALHVTIFPLVLLAIILTSKYSPYALAYGYGNDEGVRFRRVMKWHFVPWADIEAVEYARIGPPPPGILLRRRIGLSRRVAFALSAKIPVSQAWAEMHGKVKPELVTWLEEQMIAHGRDPHKVVPPKAGEGLAEYAIYAALFMVALLSFFYLLVR